MKKIDRLVDIIGLADDKYIDAAQPEHTRQKQRGALLRKQLICAACLVLVISAALKLPDITKHFVGHDGAAVDAAPSTHNLADEIGAAPETEVSQSGNTEYAGIGTDVTEDKHFSEAYQDTDGIVSTGAVPDTTVLPAEDSLYFTDTRTPKNADIYASETEIAWSWEDLTDMERYTAMTCGEKPYRSCYAVIPAQYLDRSLGSGIVRGYEFDTEEAHETACEIFTIRGIAEQRLLAVRMEDAAEYILFAKDVYDPPETLGVLANAYALAEYLPLMKFHYDTDSTVSGSMMMLTAEHSTVLWEMLSACADAAFAEEYPGDGEEHITFTAESEVFGITNRAFTITAEGYLKTNAFDYGFAYFIGETAAREIIAYATANGTPYEQEPRYYLVGTVTEIGEDWFLLDDSVMMENPADGLVFRVNASSPYISRYLRDTHFVGKTVQIEYDGEILNDGLRVEHVIALDMVHIDENGDVMIPE